MTEENLGKKGRGALRYCFDKAVGLTMPHIMLYAVIAMGIPYISGAFEATNYGMKVVGDFGGGLVGDYVPPIAEAAYEWASELVV